jgi:hypothetical protein
MGAKVVGVLIEHDGAEYLVSADDAGLPDLRERADDGTWSTIKKKGPGGRAGHTAREILQALGTRVPEDHTQQQIKKLVIHAVTEIIRKFFDSARW